ncbi:hypothetical protein RhiirA1_505402 [Rhizophagus irregularis]|uniref:Uncharacterized protein n=2 Tax=Rhizophagus irregularis TaxID=588596 RepID=A0A2N0QUS1_9GLOM|nr:hypothetical protein RhiirA1_505402 [Rhizophagus irregularis]
MTNRNFHEDYPNNPYIYAQYTSGGKNFCSKYKIIALGHYPQNVKYTQKNKHGVQYQIPDGYIVKTEIAGQMLCCETKYTFADKVLYTIMWKEGRAEWMVSSERSASGAVNAFLKRPLNEVQSVSQQNKRYASFGKEAHEQIKQLIIKHQMVLESGNPICIYNMELGCENQIINIKYSSIIDNARLDAYVRACDEALLGRDGYRRLAAVEARLIREYQVAQRRIEITKSINDQIHIGILNFDKELNRQPILDDDDESQDNPDGIVVDEQEIGNGVYRSIRSLLKILIPIWNKLILQPGDTINLKLGGDGKENYETLAKVGHLFEYQLRDLQENGIYDDNGVHWPIEFFFSGDWKFMYNIMGLNAPNAKYFCLYCDCEASERWNMDLQWPINKNTKCKKKPVLFPTIKQENYIPDELHLMLRISDVLMECFFNDLFKRKEFEQQIKSQIEQTMKTIKVHFEFFKSKSHGGKWDWTSLMGPDKKKVLQYFPVSDFISERRGKDIEKLWRDFYELYLVLRKPILTNSEIDDFKVKVRLFFGGTTMGGGIKGKSVVHDIMEFENRQLYYLINNTPQEIQMRNINAEDKENKDPYCN